MTKQYAERDAMALDEAGGYYMRHVMAMTGEQLHGKGDIAAELGWRDMQIAALQEQVQKLAAEVSECRRFIAEELGPEAEITFRGLSTERADAVIREIGAKAVEVLAENLATPNPELVDGTNRINKAVAWYARQFAAQLRTGSTEGGV